MEISTTYLSPMVHTTENSFKILYENKYKSKGFITIFIKWSLCLFYAAVVILFHEGCFNFTSSESPIEHFLTVYEPGFSVRLSTFKHLMYSDTWKIESLRQISTICYSNFAFRGSTLSAFSFNFVDNIHPRQHLAENNMMFVQPKHGMEVNILRSGPKLKVELKISCTKSVT